MPKFDLIATRDFTYNTRRLKAGDAFQARNRDDAKILIELLGKARVGRPKAEVPPPPADVAEKAKAVANASPLSGADAIREDEFTVTREILTAKKPTVRTHAAARKAPSKRKAAAKK
jgi:hypothetical protein